MHAIQHSLAHRAAPVTRTRVRWQPYTSTTQTPALKSPNLVCLNTPACSVSSLSSSTSSPYSTPACESDRCRPPPPSNNVSLDGHSRESQRNKFVMGLVDQTVKSLCEIWKPQDIPSVFLTSSRALDHLGNELSTSTGQPSLTNKFRNTQLPSPESPTSRASPIPPPLPKSRGHTQAKSDKSVLISDASQRNLVPIKSFVHEVLRRSRTSGGILQTALCYLEAIRRKVPELVRQEKAGEGLRGEPDLASRITVSDDHTMVVDEYTYQTDSRSSTGAQIDVSSQCDGAAQAQQFEGIRMPLDNAAAAAVKKHKTSTPLPPLPPLPSPLLCPRRTFLAALILASKFTQDRCYSNRAWAKLSGLPPREIGRCERALGDALDWRLWVGKATVSPPAADRSVTRCRSDGDLFAGSRQKSGNNTSFGVAQTSFAGMQSLNPHASRIRSGLRRCATILVDAPPLPVPLGPAMPLTAESVSRLNLYVPRPQCAASLSGSSAPPTPALSDSPSSSSSMSSEGERTVQVQSFVDESFAPGSCFVSSSQSFGFTKTLTDGFYSGGDKVQHLPFVVAEHDSIYPCASFGIDSAFTGPGATSIEGGVVGGYE